MLSYFTAGLRMSCGTDVSAQSAGHAILPLGALQFSTIELFAGRNPDPEVIRIATGRQISAKEKRILSAEADLRNKRGELGTVLRRKLMYYSMMRVISLFKCLI